MPKGNRAAIHIHTRAVQSEFGNHRKALRSERLVKLRQVDVFDPKVSFLKRALDQTFFPELIDVRTVISAPE